MPDLDGVAARGRQESLAAEAVFEAQLSLPIGEPAAESPQGGEGESQSLSRLRRNSGPVSLQSMLEEIGPEGAKP